LRTNGTVEDFVRFHAERLRLGELTPERTERLSGTALALNTLYQEAGGVLEFSHVACDPPLNAESHQQAVLTTFERLVEENGRNIQATSAKYGDDLDAFFRLRIDRRSFDGRWITLREFLGWHYDMDRDCLALSGVDPDHLNDLFLAPYVENADGLCNYSSLAQQWDPDLDLEGQNGFAYAFSNPPYGMQSAAGGNQHVNMLFRAMCWVHFGGLSRDLEIMRWETDWTNYFESGREWWGEYLWTLNRPGQRAIVVIAGSSTD
jgi:hypothetical protein